LHLLPKQFLLQPLQALENLEHGRMMDDNPRQPDYTDP
jgi:hypothetical protein